MYASMVHKQLHPPNRFWLVFGWGWVVVWMYIVVVESYCFFDNNCCWARWTAYPPSRLRPVTLSHNSIYEIKPKSIGSRECFLLLWHFLPLSSKDSRDFPLTCNAIFIVCYKTVIISWGTTHILNTEYSLMRLRSYQVHKHVVISWGLPHMLQAYYFVASRWLLPT